MPACQARVKGGGVIFGLRRLQGSLGAAIKVLQRYTEGTLQPLSPFPQSNRTAPCTLPRALYSRYSTELLDAELTKMAPS